MQPDFMLAQISDLHIKRDGKLAYQKVDTYQALTNAINVINQFSPAIDAVLVSGDLTDFGYETDCKQLKSLLANLSIPYYLITGNHDQRDPLRKTFPKQPFPQNGPLNWVIDNPHLRLIGLDSLVEGKPYGSLSEATLDFLDAKLAESDKPTIVTLHHPPVIVGIEHMDVQNLQNATALQAVIEKYDCIQRVLCGHLHRYVCTQWANTQMMICPGVSHQVALDVNSAAPAHFTLEPPAMLLHMLFDNQLVTHYYPLTEFDGSYPFFDAEGQLID